MFIFTVGLISREATKKRGLEVLHNGWFEAETFAALSAKTFSEHEDLAGLKFFVDSYQTDKMDARLWNAVKVLQIPVGDQKPAWHLDYNFG